jgi:hypothetical protein
MNAILQRNDTELNQPLFSLLRDCLIDSGASSHMTPHAEDFILNVEESHAVVQIADGALIRAELCGTVQIRIQDLNAPGSIILGDRQAKACWDTVNTTLDIHAVDGLFCGYEH